MAGPERDAVVSTFIELADSLVESYDPFNLLYTLTERCVALFDVEAAAVMLGDADETLKVVASSTEDARIIELLEVQQRQGPCFDAYTSGEAVSYDDIASHAERWPGFAAEAADVGYTAVDAIPLRLRGEVIGAINLFRREAQDMSPQDLATIRGFVDIATIGILQERAVSAAESVSDQLRVALRTRIVIEQAKGVIAQAGQLTMEEAFHRLRSHARSHSQRLADVARQVIDGRLDLATARIGRPAD